MLNKIFGFANQKLWLKLLFPVSLIVLLVVILMSWFNISFMQKTSEAQLRQQNEMLSFAIEGGMFDSLSVGENDVVRNQFKRLKTKLSNVKVFVYDFNGNISFSTDNKSVGKNISSYIDKDASENLLSTFKKDTKIELSSKSRFGDKNYHVKSESIENDTTCYHCHGASRKIIGGISVFSSNDVFESTVAKGRNISIAIGSIGLLLIIAFIWIFFHYIVNSKVKMILDATHSMRQGDFTKKIEIGQGDEMNHILARINLVNKDLRQSLIKVKNNSEQMLSSASDLDGISENLYTSSTETASKASTLSAAAEEMSINNKSISSSMDQSTENLNTVSSAVEEMSSTVNEILENVNKSKKITQGLVEDFVEIVKVVDELGVRADDVDAVTDEIRSISEQVSMLALNAKIEAARAGEAGKGFAVVAQEITTLASETNDATLDADEKLHWIKKMTEETAAKIKGITGVVKDSDDAMTTISAAIEEQSITTQEIANNINSVFSEISDVNTNVTEGANVAAEIARDITIIESDAKNVEKSSSKLSENASGLTKMAEDFMELMKKFTV